MNIHHRLCRFSRIFFVLETTASVIDDRMNRSPVFVFEDARYAWEFGKWVTDNFEKIKAKAEETTSRGQLLDICQYPMSKMRWLRETKKSRAYIK